ncbi:MAG TPA: HDOD domain-containing protein [Syntrophales bacterium]|nr:HDOD domain-containing protein [Syntrophales bacterium]
MIVDELLHSIQKIPAFPGTVQRVAEILSHADYSVSELVSVIEYDQSITANLLKMSNAAYFGSRHRVSTVQDAVMFLGQENIIRAVVASGVVSFYRSGRGYGVKGSDLWKHSVGVALMSQILSKKLYSRKDGELFTAALLHDVGKVVLGEYIDRSFEKIARLVKKEGYAFLTAEKEVFGIDHAELGGKIAERWNFPPKHVEVIACHHRPDQSARERIAPWVVYLADQVCLMMGVGGGSDGLAYWGLKEVVQMFKLRQRDIEECMIQLAQELALAEDIVNVFHG